MKPDFLTVSPEETLYVCSRFHIGVAAGGGRLLLGGRRFVRVEADDVGWTDEGGVDEGGGGRRDGVSPLALSLIFERMTSTVWAWSRLLSMTSVPDFVVKNREQPLSPTTVVDPAVAMNSRRCTLLAITYLGKCLLPHQTDGSSAHRSI